MNLPTIHTAKPTRRKLILYFLDAIMILLIGSVAALGFAILHDLHNRFFDLAAIVLISVAIHSLISAIFRLNSIVWRYAESKEYIYLFLVESLASAIGFTVSLMLIPLSVTLLVSFELSILLSIVITRIMYHAWCNRHKHGNSENGKRLLIIGAGAAACRLLDEINSMRDCGLIPVGLVDDSKEKLERKVHGIRVLGPVEDLVNIAKVTSAEVIYLAIPSLTAERRAEILNICINTDCTVKSLPRLTEIAENTSLMRSVRDITPEELLGRDQVSLESEELLDFIQGKCVAITGGGGSIGSEICRQVAAKQPARLIIIDVYENNAYDIQQELIIKYGNKLNMEVYIANVCDYEKILRIFENEKPDIVVHAAAHKHVPLMETVPDEAVLNNVFGTWNTVMAANKAKVGNMILISTDKAVNPTNIMGATKRICEMIIQYADSVLDHTQYAAVRFGNVLGSNGSVIPLFKKQIEERSDVTVTHPDMIRYFMTISEASQLVLTAGTMANGGEIFVLDMGEPVKIDDLAKNMIRLAGLTLGKDINIRYIGLRPGEKLFEELLMSEEGLNKTENKKIFIGKQIDFDHDSFVGQLSELRAICEDPASAPIEVERKLMEIVPTFHRFELMGAENK
ncbi:MAG: polysaccharide biosynthesis protein [Clostridia bacterium]|nr:polysaccharide biosynthesis protein [Clostridia bacterium]